MEPKLKKRKKFIINLKKGNKPFLPIDLFVSGAEHAHADKFGDLDKQTPWRKNTAIENSKWECVMPCSRRMGEQPSTTNRRDGPDEKESVV